MLPTFNRETCTDAEWRLFFLTYYLVVLSLHRTLRLNVSKTFYGRLSCPICSQNYLTSGTEQEPCCGDCIDNAKAVETELAKSHQKIQRDREREAALACDNGYCNCHQRQDDNRIFNFVVAHVF